MEETSIEVLRAAKQSFLREEIIEKDFSTDDFILFCDQKKSSNIDDWTLEELKEIVKEFKSVFHTIAEEQKEISENEPKLSKEGSLDTIESPIKTELLTTEPNKIRSLSDSREDRNPEIKQKPVSLYTITTYKAPDTALSLQDFVEIKVENAKISSGGMFSSAKISFPIVTQPLGWIVKRQIEDFVWLRNILATVYPANYVPPNPPKRVMNSTKNEALSKQQSYLQRFLAAIVRNPLFRRCEYLVSFLSQDDEKAFANVKKESLKVKRPELLENFWTLDGNAICDPYIVEQENSKFDEYLNITEITKKKLKRQTDEIVAIFKDLSGRITEIARSFEVLENIQVQLPDIPGTKPLYGCLKESFFHWSAHTFDTANLIQSYCNLFFKYGYNELIPLKEMARERDTKLSNYLKSYQRLQQKKDKLWINGDIYKWGMKPEHANIDPGLLQTDKELAFPKMLYKESKEIEKQKDEAAHLNFQVKSEMRRILLDNQLIENLHFSDLGKSFTDHMSHMHLIWNELVAKLANIRSRCIPSRSHI
ncbi:unnamed protein product [Blepharisma stoltei]|uniref:PX domain-containing protein n=1 Tax=Blepharisma stoltei TaxID=1481888 RepID=A0AAU9IT74_9CILI|nr:unnamed protein product [Blepharisma stoltei]